MDITDELRAFVATAKTGSFTAAADQIEVSNRLTFDLRLHDAFVDLASEGIDAAFRIGQPDVLSPKSRKLEELHSLLLASPDYFAVHGAPLRPDDLINRACILDTNRRAPRSCVFRKNGSGTSVEVHGQFQVNSARAAVEMAAAGLGVFYAPRFALVEAMEAGRLVPVMNDYMGTTAPVSAVYLEGRTLPRKVRALIDFAVSDIRQAGDL